MSLSGGVTETVNTDGSTDHYNGTVGTTAVDIPSSAGNIIQSILIDNTNTASTKTLLVSFDGGTTYKTIGVGATFSWTVKGNLRQVKIKGGAASTSYEILLNRENN